MMIATRIANTLLLVYAVSGVAGTVYVAAGVVRWIISLIG